MAEADAQSTLDAPTVTLLGPVKKGESSELVMSGAEAYPEDSFNGLYAGGTGGSTNAILEPDFKPGVLYALASQNNILSQCVEAMEVNIDGTGHSIEAVEADSKEATNDKNPQKVALTDFFAHPYPGTSLIAIRRATRRDLEVTGNGYTEFISSASDKLMLMNHLDANYMRLVRLDDAVPVKKMIRREGVEIEITLLMRERRFIQHSNGTKVYFKEFGASRDLNKYTGEWAKPGQRLPANLRASEVKHWVGNKEPRTAYGAPRWINQMPSVLGSRKAEEHNLDFFDAGGIPPMLIMVHGGTLGKDVKDVISAHLSGKGNKHRAAVVEATSTSGTVENGGSVRVTVERFGAERQSDSMFQKYDEKCEDHVRVGFRLPPLFVGKASDYNFATAYTAYMIAEAQVFWPEREDFDSWINENVVRRLGVKDFKFRSLPLTLTDVTNQLAALEMVVDKFVDGEEVVKKLNEIVGLSLKYTKQEPPPMPGMVPGAAPAFPGTAKPQLDAAGKPLAASAGKTPTKPAKDNPAPLRAVKQESAYIRDLADKVTEVLDDSGVVVCSKQERDDLRLAVANLSPSEMQEFSSILAAKSVQMYWANTEDLEELCGCAVHGAI
jgi:PBSX family phage portal protein